MTTYVIKRGDTAPAPAAQLVDGNGAPVNLAGATVRFKVRANPATAPKIDAAATIVDAATGRVSYTPVAADTATEGTWLAEWQVTYASLAVQTFPGSGYDEFRVSADLDAAVSPAGAGYCTVGQARNAGATGTDAEVQAAIDSAELRIDRYTQQRWKPKSMQVAAELTGNGVALLPRQVDPLLPVTVRYQGATTDLVATAYQVTSSRTPGSVDAVYLGRGGSDLLVAGAEPYNGGWANLLRRTGKLLVTATFGTATTPGEVVRATALLAGSILSGGGADQGGGTSLVVNDEGESLAITTGGGSVPAPDTTPMRTTGVAAADQLLAPLQRRRVRLSGV